MSCESEIHSLSFLKMSPNLRVFEVDEVRLNTLDGMEKATDHCPAGCSV